MSIDTTYQTSSFPLTTKGDIMYHNGTSSVRFAVGSNSQILSTTGTGLLWKTPGTARSRFERIATSSVTASGSVTRIAFESIPSTYTHLLIKGKCGTSGSSSERFININFNSSSVSGDYRYYAGTNEGTGESRNQSASSTALQVQCNGATVAGSTRFGVLEMYIPFYATASIPKLSLWRAMYSIPSSPYATADEFAGGIFVSTTTISSIHLNTNAATNYFTANTEFTLYGF